MTIQELFAIDLPIIQAPMAGVQDSKLAIAVSNAGGLGSLPCAMLGVDALQQEIDSIRQHCARPFNLNFFCHDAPAPDPERDATWRALFANYYAELGVDPAAAPAGAARKPFDQTMADVVSAVRPAVVSFHFGLPSIGLMNQVRRAGARIISSATTVAEAQWLAERGVDAIIAQGVEAGGHRGMFLTQDLDSQIPTLTLLRQIRQAIDLPVIAAGGIADAGDVRAALALGAAGVQVGTAYLLCPEARTSAVHRAALLSEQARQTALTNVFSGRPARGIVNRMMRELGPMNAMAPQFPLATPASAMLRSRAESLGSSDFSPLWAGQKASSCQAMPAAELTRALCRG